MYSYVEWIFTYVISLFAFVWGMHFPKNTSNNYALCNATDMLVFGSIHEYVPHEFDVSTDLSLLEMLSYWKKSVDRLECNC